MPDYDLDRVRADFPILSGGEVIYLDNAATSLSPRQVVDALADFYLNVRANVHRGLHRLSARSTEMYSEARREVADFIGADPGELVFVRNSTEALNMVARGMGLRRGDAVVVSVAEHHSNLLPWMRLRDEVGVELRVIGVSPEGEYDLDALAEAARGAKVISVAWVSNVLGSVAPVEEIGRIAAEEGAAFVLDGAQGVPHLPTDVRRLGVDFLAFSAHKMLGPTGIGGLYIRSEAMEELAPLNLGGGMISDVTLDGYVPAPPPERFEAGTPPVAQAVGFAAAVRYLRSLGMEAISSWERELAARAVEGLSSIPGVRVYGPPPGRERSGVVSFNVDGVDPHDVAAILDEVAGIAVRSGHHCALPLVRGVLGVQGTVRASFYLYNTEEEVDRLVEVVGEVAGGA